MDIKRESIIPIDGLSEMDWRKSLSDMMNYLNTITKGDFAEFLKLQEVKRELDNG